MPFQTEINDQQAPGVAGDFASLNTNLFSVLAGPGALTAPAGGLTVGNFFWVGPDGTCSQSFVAGYQVAFLGRNMQGLITQFLGEATMQVPQGFMVTGFNGGDFFASFPGGAAAGDYVFADPNDGTPIASTTNSAPAAASATASAGFSGTASLTLNSTTLNVTAVTHGILSPGDAVTDSTTGANIPAGTKIVSQLTGAAGGVGTYKMSAQAAATAAGDTVVSTSSNMLVTAVASGSLNNEDAFTGTNVTAGTAVTGQVTPFSGVASTTNASAVLNVTAVQPDTDLLRVGAKVVMNGVPAGTTISAQTAGTPGGVGAYTLSANATATAAGVAITTGDGLGQTGLYTISAAQAFGVASAPITITVAGTAQATPFRVRGTYSAALTPNAAGVWKISSN